MSPKIKSFLKISLFTFLLNFSWDFWANISHLQSEGTLFSDKKCEDIPANNCLNYSGCELSGPSENEIEQAQKKVDEAYDEHQHYLSTGNTNLPIAIKEKWEKEKKNLEALQSVTKVCQKRSIFDDNVGETARDDRKAANEVHCSTYKEDGNFWKSVFYNDGKKITRETHGKTVFEGAKSQLKTACKNDPQCKWSSISKKCNGKSGASTEEYLICSQAGVSKCGITIGCALSRDGKQCLPEEDEEIKGEEVFEEFGAYTGPVFGGPGLRAGARIAKEKLDNTISKERSLKKLIIYWTNFALSVTAIIAVVALVYAGILYITDLGDGSNSEKAKKIILYVAIGIIVILGSYAIVNTVMKARFGNEESAISHYQNKIIPKNFLS